MTSLLEVRNLEQRFDLHKDFLSKITFEKGRIHFKEKVVKAVNGVSLKVEQGEVYSLVGESGCGKSTTARTIIKLMEPKGGQIFYKGREITHLSKKEMLPFRRNMQMIFQDPYASLNPRQKVVDILVEPIIFHKVTRSRKEARELALELLAKVGIRPEQASRYPHQFSGGQRQRIGVARALGVNPEFIIADEPVSALDVSIQAQILNLLMEIKEEFNFSYLFIAHDLSVVKHISDKVAIMYLGRIVERGSKKHIFQSPTHPYTLALFSSIPKLSGKNMEEFHPVEGEIPGAINLPPGCAFHPRCLKAQEICRRVVPEEKEVGPGHFMACHL